MQLTLLTHIEYVDVLFYIGIAFIALPIIFYVLKFKKILPSKKPLNIFFGLMLTVGLICEIPSLYKAELESQYKISKYSKSDILYIAAENKELKSLKIMLKKGADPSAVTRFGQTSFYNSVKKGDIDAVLLMAAHGADINATGSSYTPLCAACINGDIDMVKVLLELGADPDYAPDVYPSALNVAAAYDKGYNYPLIETLCSAGADKSAVTMDGSGRRWVPFKYYFHKAWQSRLTPEEQENYDKIAELLEQPYKDWVMSNPDFVIKPEDARRDVYETVS